MAHAASHAAAAAPKVDSGDTAWVLVSAALVLLGFVGEYRLQRP